MSSVHITTGDGKSTEYDEEQVRSMLQQGSLRDDALYWREGMSDWQSIQGLFPGLVTSRRGASAVSREAAVSEYTFTKNPFGLTRVLKVMLWVQLGVVVLSILSDFGQLSLVAGGDFTVEAAEANDFRQSMVGILNFGVFIVTAVIFAQWIYRANLNCQGFGAEGMEFTPRLVGRVLFHPLSESCSPLSVNERDMECKSQSQKMAISTREQHFGLVVGALDRFTRSGQRVFSNEHERG